MTGHPESEARRPWMLALIALLGAALSFNAVRQMATPYAGTWGGIATALLFDAAMWLSARWYIATVRAGYPLRPALWLSLGLIAATIWVNVSGAADATAVVVHGIGPALFAAFTWIEASIQLRAYRNAPGQRERVPAGQRIIHPFRSARIALMMTATGTRSYTAARAMCQNREARRRTWKAEHRPSWLAWPHRRIRPGWRAKVDPVEYTAYRWGSITTTAHVIGTVTAAGDGVRNGTGGVPANTSPALASGNATSDENVPVSTAGTPGNTSRAAARPPGPDEPEPSGNVSGTAVPDGNTSRTARTETRRGSALPEGVSGRNLDAARLAGLISADLSVRQIMRDFAVSYDKAVTAKRIAANGSGTAGANTR